MTPAILTSEPAIRESGVNVAWHGLISHLIGRDAAEEPHATKCQINAAAATAINASTNISLSSGRCFNVIGTACRISFPADVSTTRAPIALSELPIDLHGELAKTLQKRLSTVKVAAAALSMFASPSDGAAVEDSSHDVSGNLAD